MLTDLRYRLRALVRRAAMERELDDELRFHIEQETQRHVRAGMPRVEAQRRAHQEFGHLDRIKEQAREARGVGWIDAALHDLRYAWRTFRARPAFAASVVTTLGLGFAACTAVFDVADRLLFRPPAYLQDPERVHRVYASEVRAGVPLTEQAFSYRLFRELSDSTRSFDAVAAFQTPLLPVGGGEHTVETRVATVSASLFGLFDADPVLGRFFREDEDRPPAGERVAVLSHGFWRSAFGASHDVIGHPLQVGDAAYTVVGVAPPRFAGFSEAGAPALFVPITAWAYGRAPDYASHHGWTWLEVVVQRRPGVSVEAANADLTAALARSREEQRRVDPGLPSPAAARLRAEAGPVQPGRGPLAGPEADVVLWVMALALVVRRGNAGPGHRPVAGGPIASRSARGSEPGVAGRVAAERRRRSEGSRPFFSDLLIA